MELAALIGRLNPDCRRALERAAQRCLQRTHHYVEIEHLLLELLDIDGGDFACLLPRFGLERDALVAEINLSLELFKAGNTRTPALSAHTIGLLEDAVVHASVLGQAQIRSGLLLLALLDREERRALLLNSASSLLRIPHEALQANLLEWIQTSREQPAAPNRPAAGGDKPESAPDPLLDQYTQDLTAEARAGRIDPIVGRDGEIRQCVDILLRRRQNNPILVGAPGVGKTAVVEGLALRIVQGRVPEPLRMVELWGLDLGALQAGASVKGEFEKRLKAVIDEVKGSSRPIILFIDEAHTLIGAGNTAGGSDAANLLKPALARGELRTIAATTWSEYKKYFEKDPALTRRFQLVKLEEPTPEQAVHILRGLRPIYEASHQVFIGDDALQASATLAGRYLSGRQLPDKAIDVLDTACARVASALAEPPRRLSAMENELNQIDAESAQVARDGRAGRAVAPGRLEALATARKDIEQSVVELRQAWERQKALVDEIVALRARDDVEGLSQVLAGKVAQLSELQRAGALLHADVGAEQIAQVIADWTGIPATTISSDQMARLDSLPGNLKGRVKGQDAALDVVYRRLLTALADLRRPGTPMGAFLLVGPSGVGKTETALAVADSLFGGEQFLTTINMSEYQEKFTVSRLLGAPPGYVGYGEGGVLTEAIRKQPYSVVLLDEVEKAHPEVLNVFYQAFDKGELADGEGRRIDCQNVLFFLTSNLGFDEGDNSLTDLDGDALRQRLMRFFKPALLARMQIVPYRYLDEEVLNEIIDSRLQRLRQQFRQRYDATLVVVDAARDELRARCARHQNGARMLDASIDGELLPPLSLAVLQRLSRGDKIQRAQVGWCDGKFAATLD